MKRFVFLLLNVFVLSGLWADDFSLDSTRKKLKELVEQESKITLSVNNAKPNRRITILMEKVNAIGQELMTQEKQTDEIVALSEQCLAILAALRERRIYAYMLWAERCLESASAGKYGDLKGLKQEELMRLYAYLSNINISIIRENMLSREIISRLAAIYDCLDNDNKPKARINAIQQQRDVFSLKSSIPIRKSLDDF